MESLSAPYNRLWNALEDHHILPSPSGSDLLQLRRRRTISLLRCQWWSFMPDINARWIDVHRVPHPILCLIDRALGLRQGWRATGNCLGQRVHCPARVAAQPDLWRDPSHLGLAIHYRALFNTVIRTAVLPHHSCGEKSVRAFRFAFHSWVAQFRKGE